MNKEDAIRPILENFVPPGNLVTHWLIVLEATNGETQDLHLATSSGMTPWMMYGMLEAAHDVASSQELYADEEGET